VDKSKAAKIIFGNKEKKQFPDPEGLEREKPSSAIEGSTQPIGFETNRSRNKFSEAAPPMPGAKQTLNNRLQRVGSVRRGVSLAAPRKEEVDGNMENKTFTQFVTEAKRGRPRKLKPGEQADTEHLQDQLSKLTHANHVTVHFKNGEKHEIPRAHANKALIHLSGLKPIHRADHVEHMHSSKENFYHTLSTKSVPSKKKSITLAGPKLRKEEIEQIDEAGMALSANHKTAIASHIKKMWGKGKVTFDHTAGIHTVSHSDGIQTHVHSIRIKGGKAQVTHFMDMDEEVEQLDEVGNTRRGREALAGYIRKSGGGGMDGVGGLMYQAANKEPTDPSRVDLFKKAGKRIKGVERAVSRLAKEEHENDDGWYAHKEMHGPKAISREDWKKGVRPGKSLKKEEVESDEKKKKDHHKLLQKFRHRIDEVKAIKGKHANKLHAAPVINPGKVGYAGKGTKPKVQSLHREDYAPLESGDKQPHVDQKTVDAKSRKQGGEKPKKPKMELTKEAWELYESLSGAHKAVFENMDSAERDRLVDKYISGKR